MTDRSMTPARYELHAHRALESPVLLLATESWLDAGFGAQGAIAAIREMVPTEVLATFTADEFIDFRARRPIAQISDGVLTSLIWPEIQLRVGQDSSGKSVLVLVGPEPDMAWHAFVRDVVGLAKELGVHLVASLGAFAAPVPHTRPVRLTAIATVAELAAQVGVVHGATEVPAGIQTALQEGFAAAGIPAIGIWARVPHYLASLPYPAASAALVDALATVVGVELDAGELHAAAASVLTQIDDILAASEEHREVVRGLEAMFDGEVATPPDFSNLPSGDELAAELERFLRGEQEGN
jgi:predicted ATP-grasp superfamily ATP-dependent carboligase